MLLELRKQKLPNCHHYLEKQLDSAELEVMFPVSDTLSLGGNVYYK